MNSDKINRLAGGKIIGGNFEDRDFFVGGSTNWKERRREEKDHLANLGRCSNKEEEEKNAHTFILHSRKNKRLFVNIGRKGKARFSALRSNRAFISAETLGPGVSCPCHCFISKALFRGHSETRNGTKETKKKKEKKKKKKKTHNKTFSFPFRLLSSFLAASTNNFSFFFLTFLSSS